MRQKGIGIILCEEAVLKKITHFLSTAFCLAVFHRHFTSMQFKESTLRLR